MPSAPSGPAEQVPPRKPYEQPRLKRCGVVRSVTGSFCWGDDGPCGD